jgi:hypothetical protein
MRITNTPRSTNRMGTPIITIGSTCRTSISTRCSVDWFALKAESFARFFGTPTFLIAPTVIVAVWIAVSMLGFTKFDVYPFILLNLLRARIDVERRSLPWPVRESRLTSRAEAYQRHFRTHGIKRRMGRRSATGHGSAIHLAPPHDKTRTSFAAYYVLHDARLIVIRIALKNASLRPLDGHSYPPEQSPSGCHAHCGVRGQSSHRSSRYRSP